MDLEKNDVLIIPNPHIRVVFIWICSRISLIMQWEIFILLLAPRNPYLFMYIPISCTLATLLFHCSIMFSTILHPHQYSCVHTSNPRWCLEITRVPFLLHRFQIGSRNKVYYRNLRTVEPQQKLSLLRETKAVLRRDSTLNLLKPYFFRLCLCYIPIIFCYHC